MIFVVYRDSAAMNNKDHLAHYSFRDEHTADGELGVQVKTYQTSKERAQ